MEIVYRLFKQEVVEEGDIFWVGIGGFTIQPTRVFAVDESGFNYENSKFSIRHDYRAEFLNGMLEKRGPDGVERYVSMDVLERVRETMPDAVIIE